METQYKILKIGFSSMDNQFMFHHIHLLVKDDEKILWKNFQKEKVEFRFGDKNLLIEKVESTNEFFRKIKNRTIIQLQEGNIP